MTCGFDSRPRYKPSKGFRVFPETLFLCQNIEVTRGVTMWITGCVLVCSNSGPVVMSILPLKTEYFFMLKGYVTGFLEFFYKPHF